MDLTELRTQVRKLPLVFSELDRYFSDTTCGRCARPDFYQWYQDWHKTVINELEVTVGRLHDLENAVCGAGASTLEAKQAAKDAVDLELMLISLQEQLASVSSSIDHHVRYAHLWRLWETKLSPMTRELSAATRKFNIALAGL